MNVHIHYFKIVGISALLVIVLSFFASQVSFITGFAFVKVSFLRFISLAVILGLILAVVFAFAKLKDVETEREVKDRLKDKVQSYMKRLFGVKEEFDFEIEDYSLLPIAGEPQTLAKDKIVIYRKYAIYDKNGKFIGFKEINEEFFPEALLEELIHRKLDEWSGKFVNTPLSEAFAKVARAYIFKRSLKHVKKELKTYKYIAGIRRPRGEELYRRASSYAKALYEMFSKAKTPEERFTIAKNLHKYFE